MQNEYPKYGIFVGLIAVLLCLNSPTFAGAPGMSAGFSALKVAYQDNEGQKWVRSLLKETDDRGRVLLLVIDAPTKAQALPQGLITDRTVYRH